ncbi:hypothetical protein SAMN05428988_5432 [Chitinophaga sp. YR573]|uniref:hypothetical protein n=1 Tax=Chitinophaga sp. YR573 TaxID=1881040 RepID=UPI0008C2123B|nr:hypothetical protein [Chitinophaga sp. YR573]SEW42925.1 hypothetical protein SAMN05428988_5432 [Chitinophaga sp. YR573]
MITQKRRLLLSNISKIGSIVTMTEALEMMATYQHQTPDGIGAVLYRRELFDKLLNVPGCAGIRLVNAMHEGHHSIVLVAVDNHNVNITTVIAGKGSISPYYNPWESNCNVDKTGDFISKDVATDMIKAYQDLKPGTIKSNLYGREAFETLLSAPGCAGIRLFNGIAKDGDHKFVLVPVDAAQNAIGKCQLTTGAGMLFVDPPIIDGGVPCPPYCPPFGTVIL